MVCFLQDSSEPKIFFDSRLLILGKTPVSKANNSQGREDDPFTLVIFQNAGPDLKIREFAEDVGVFTRIYHQILTDELDILVHHLTLHQMSAIQLRLNNPQLIGGRDVCGVWLASQI